MERTIALYKLGLLDAELAMKVLAERVSRRVPLGRLAIQKKLLSMKDVMRILSAQADDPNRLRFGEMATTLGLMTLEELEWLLLEQARAVPSELDLAVELGGLDRARIDEALAAQRAERLSVA